MSKSSSASIISRTLRRPRKSASTITWSSWRKKGWKSGSKASPIRKFRKTYAERLDYELGVIIDMQFPGYFLVVADFINYAKQNGIPVGPGRGSSAGSLVAYAMRITDLDPIRHVLLFERFLNPERKSMPDIDVDFCIRGRAQVIQYVKDKYGADRVAQIATFGTLKAKAAIKDVGRALGFSFAEADSIAKLIPAAQARLRLSVDRGDEDGAAPGRADEKRRAGENFDGPRAAFGRVGAPRVDPCCRRGAVQSAVGRALPLFVDKEGGIVTQYEMTWVEKIGLVKFDFLGLKTLTLIHDCLKLIEAARGVKVDIDRLPLDDKKTYRTLCQGNTTGVFQLESTGIREMTVRIRPNCFEDLVAILALYRPGPLDSGMAEDFINRKNGKEKIKYLHPLLETILKDTYGVIVYQEQVMQTAQILAGYTMGDADILRRAMGKKDPEEMAAQRERFVSGAVAKKYRRETRHRNLRPDGNLRALRFQQVAFGGLRPGFLSDRLSQDPLSRRVHGGAVDLGNGRYRQGHQKSRRLPRQRHRGAGARHQRERRQFYPGGRQDSFRFGRRQKCRRESRRSDS